MRSDCLYCGTPLIPFGHWGLCPTCEPGYIAKVMPPAPPSGPRRYTRDELLLDKGRPTRNGAKAE